MVEASVIVPVWNRADLTHKFLYMNWQRYQDSPHIEFIIVNNGSTDATEKILNRWQKKMGQRLKAFNLPENTGFSGGNNRGEMEAANSSKVLIFTSNDVEPIGDYITPILKVTEPGTLYGAEMLGYDTGWNSFQGVIYPYLAGWCIWAERETWIENLRWDDNYFPCDYEDLDLSMQAKSQGLYTEEFRLPLRHLFGQSAQALPGGRLEATNRNRLRFIEKWDIND